MTKLSIDFDICWKRLNESFYSFERLRSHARVRHQKQRTQFAIESSYTLEESFRSFLYVLESMDMRNCIGELWTKSEVITYF